MPLRILADENIDSRIIAALPEHDIEYVAKIAPSISDEMVLKMAIKLGRTLMTNDKELAGIAAQNVLQSKHGIVFLRLGGMAPAERPQRVANVLLGMSDLNSKYLIINPRGVRLRELQL